MAQRTVMVTGASSGLGAAIVRRFVEDGDRVFGTSRSPAADNAGGVVMLPLELRSSDSIAACIETVQTRAGDIDVLVNNAGVLHTGIAEETPLATAREVFETNFFGVVEMVDAVLPRMRERRAGRIINIGSLSAWIGEPGEAFYSASKRALAGYTEALRQEVTGLGIKVSLVEPGVFRTNVLRNAVTGSLDIDDYRAVRDAVTTTMSKGLSKGGDPRMVADRVFAIARAPSPRLRHAVGADAKILPFLKLLLPQGLFEYLLRRGYGLDTRNVPLR